MAIDEAPRRVAEYAVALLKAPRRIELAEHLRLPYVVAPTTERDPLATWTEGIDASGAASLRWPAAAHLPVAPVMARLALDGDQPIPICARILDDASARRFLGADDAGWAVVGTVTTDTGEAAGSVWADAAGNVLLPFDPDEVLVNYLSERYGNELQRNGRGWTTRALLRTYYRVRGLLPRPVQIWIRRHYARVQARTVFPRWPVEPGLHDFIDLFLELLADVAGTELPYIAPWPDGHTWAVVLTHDVETAKGLAAMEPLLEIERRHGLRSSWNFVARRYRVPDELVRTLRAGGFEVGVHGLHHDGRDLMSLPQLQARLPDMRAAAQRWGAVGFRSPASHRHWEWMPLLGFDYDSSYPDTDPFEPQRGGCCSWWPFFNRNLVELPLTMPHDHTLFVILGQDDEAMWTHKAQVLRDRGGMALLVTHPDYLITGPGRAAYARFVASCAADEQAWKPLPAQVSAWWRRRAASTIVDGPDGFTVAGPAQGEARIAFARGRRGC